MNFSPLRQLLAPGLLLALAAWPQRASACAACFGRSDDAMAHGMNMGIFTLLVVIVAVLAGIASFGFFLVRRSARLGSVGAAAAESAGQTSAPLSQSISQPTP